MSDQFTDGEKYEQAWGNMAASAAAIHEFLNKRNIDPSEFWAYFGETFAPGWSDAKGDLDKVAYYVALNMTSLGCSTETTQEDGHATVQATWPKERDDLHQQIAIKPGLLQMITAFEPIMAWLGLGFSWEETQDGVVFRLDE